MNNMNTIPVELDGESYILRNRLAINFSFVLPSKGLIWKKYSVLGLHFAILLSNNTHWQN